MSDLKPQRVLRRECLDERRYFDTLLSVSLDHGLLTQNDLLRMQESFSRFCLRLVGPIPEDPAVQYPSRQRKN